MLDVQNVSVERKEERHTTDNCLPGKGILAGGCEKNEGPVRLDVKRELVASIESNGTHDVW